MPAATPTSARIELRLRTNSSAPWILIVVGTVMAVGLLGSPATEQTKKQLVPLLLVAIASGAVGVQVLRVPWFLLVGESGVTVFRGGRSKQSVSWKEIRWIQHGLARIYRPADRAFGRGHWVAGPYLMVVGKENRRIGIDAVRFRFTDREFKGLIEMTVACGAARGIPSVHRDFVETPA